MRTLMLTVVFAAAAVRAHAGGGLLDPWFGVGGITTTNFGAFGPEDVARCILVQADGRIVVAGETWPGLGASNFGVARYTANGLPDPSFGTDGRVTVHFASSDYESVGTVLPQPSLRMLLVGSIHHSLPAGSSVALVRLNQDGTLDGTFGTNGQLEVPVAGGGRIIYGGAVRLPDGRVLVHASAEDPAQPVVMRFLPDGSLDPSFGTNGQRTFPVADALANGAAMARLPDGRIVLAHTMSASSPFGVLLIRLLPDGATDLTFGTGGIVRSDWGGSETVAAVRAYPGGRFVVAGRLFTTGSDVAVARYLESGALDQTFGTAGVGIADSGASDDASALVVQQNDKLLVLGTVFDATSSDFQSVRFTSTGAVDLTFASAGFLRTSIGSGFSDDARALAIYNDASYLVAGATVVDAMNRDDFAVARYLAVTPVELIRFTVE